MVKPENTNTPQNVEFDWSKYLPEGYSTSDLEKTGGLTPIYSPDEAVKGNFPPVIGYPIRHQYLPAVQQGRELFHPWMILVHLEAPTRAVTGKAGERVAVDLKKGDRVLVPITGNVEMNEDLMLATEDPKTVTLFGIRVAGQQKVNNQPSKMWLWDIQRIGKGVKPRSDEFLRLLELKPTEHEPPEAKQLGAGVTSTGQRFDRDGVVQERRA